MDEQLNTKGFIAMVVVWLVLIFVLASQASCGKAYSCYGGDLIINSILSVGMLAPAWFAGLLISILTKSK